jgi:hypothetical protein
MTLDVAAEVQHITSAEIDTEPVPRARVAPETAFSWESGQAYAYLINGTNAFIGRKELTPRQQQDAMLSQWFAGRRASYLVKQEHHEVIGDDAPNKYPEEYFSYFRDEIGKIGFDTSQFLQREIKYQNAENTVPDFVAAQLASLGTEEAVREAVDTVNKWADGGQPSADWFRSKSSSQPMVGKAFGDAYLDSDVLRFNGSFWRFAGQMQVRNLLILDIKDLDVDLWTYKGWFRCVNGPQLPDRINQALQDKLGGNEQDIHNEPI